MSSIISFLVRVAVSPLAQTLFFPFLFPDEIVIVPLDKHGNECQSRLCWHVLRYCIITSDEATEQSSVVQDPLATLLPLRHQIDKVTREPFPSQSGLDNVVVGVNYFWKGHLLISLILLIFSTLVSILLLNSWILDSSFSKRSLSSSMRAE